MPYFLRCELMRHRFRLRFWIQGTGRHPAGHRYQVRVCRLVGELFHGRPASQELRSIWGRPMYTPLEGPECVLMNYNTSTCMNKHEGASTVAKSQVALIRAREWQRSSSTGTGFLNSIIYLLQRERLSREGSVAWHQIDLRIVHGIFILLEYLEGFGGYNPHICTLSTHVLIARGTSVLAQRDERLG